jgi:gamma-glutamyltranspeptidase
VLALVDVLEAPSAGGGDTTNLAVVDPEGNACVLTSSLGLGSGDFLPGLDLHSTACSARPTWSAAGSSRASGCRA